MLYERRYRKLRLTLKKMRQEAPLTQVELAEKLEKAQSYVSKVESGERYLDVVEFVLWCEACGAKPGNVIADV